MAATVGIKRVTLRWQPQVAHPGRSGQVPRVHDAGWLLPGEEPKLMEGTPLWEQAVCCHAFREGQQTGPSLLPGLFVPGLDVDLEITQEDPGSGWFKIASEWRAGEALDDEGYTLFALYGPDGSSHELGEIDLSDAMRDHLASYDVLWFRKHGPVGPPA